MQIHVIVQSVHHILLEHLPMGHILKKLLLNHALEYINSSQTLQDIGLVVDYLYFQHVGDE